MMLAGDARDFRCNAGLQDHALSVYGMVADDLHAFQRGQLIMRIWHILRLVFRIKGGGFQLADVMIIGRRARQQRVRPHCLGSRLCQVAYHDGMMIGAGGLHRKPVQQGVGGVAKLHQLHRR